MAKTNYYSSACVFVMEFRIKFETMKHRDNAVGDFGNRGQSWHGALIFYYD